MSKWRARLWLWLHRICPDCGLTMHSYPFSESSCELMNWCYCRTRRKIERGERKKKAALDAIRRQV